MDKKAMIWVDTDKIVHHSDSFVLILHQGMFMYFYDPIDDCFWLFNESSGKWRLSDTSIF